MNFRAVIIVCTYAKTAPYVIYTALTARTKINNLGSVPARTTTLSVVFGGAVRVVTSRSPETYKPEIRYRILFVHVNR